ncbi:MAG: hypothetical protein ABI669_12055 [Usitatibacter sp.]
MIASFAARPGLFARFFFALAALAFLSSCGSGAVSGPPAVGSATLAISPANATLFAESPFTFLVTGGTGVYLVTTSNQVALPAVGTLTGNTLIVIPGPVSVDTPVTIEVRDTGIATPISTTVTVKPRTVSNAVTVIPSASQSAACGTSVCAGGDAEVRVQLQQTGLPLANRAVRFDVVSGEFRLITSAPGATEVLSISGTATSDQSGVASIRVRVLPDALSQTALLQVTDISSGFTQRASFSIAPSSNAPLNAQPSTITFQGVTANTCASGISADVIVFGGRPPYQISQPGSFAVSPTIVPSSGGRFTITAIGQCSASSAIAIVDANGATVGVTASNTLSDVTPADPVDPPFTVSTRSVVLATCNTIGNIALTGGSGTYFGASGNSAVTVTVTGSVASIFRTSLSGPIPPATTPGATDTTPATVVVTFSDGQTGQNVNVSLTGSRAVPGGDGTGLGRCP